MINTLGKRTSPVALATDQEIPLRGISYAVQSTGKARGLVSTDETAKIIWVPGAAPHVKRRLLDWLKKQAEADLTKASQHYALAMDCSFTSLTVRDQKSRWGSCSTDRSLSYSWRLILAPPLVLDYVAAHEVAHLLEMNHGPKFWRLVLSHCKHTREAKRWLKTHGHTLHRYT